MTAMAYMSQEHKAKIVKLAKPILEKYRMKATFSVDHHSTIVCTLKAGPLEFVPQYDGESINHYYLNDRFSGDKLQFLTELKQAMNDGNWDNSDPMTDYFDVGHYINIKVGQYQKPYKVTP
jgi:hypothetical protein